MANRRFISQAPRRSTAWVQFQSAGFVDHTASQHATLATMTQAQLERFVPCTITRTVGLMVVSADTDFITNQVYSGAAGACVVREEARAAGIGSLPQPFGSAEDEMWFWHQYFAEVFDDRADSDLRLSTHYKIDSKAQRKVSDGDAIVFTGQGGGEADGFDVNLMVRMLLKLH